MYSLGLHLLCSFFLCKGFKADEGNALQLEMICIVENLIKVVSFLKRLVKINY